MDRRQVVVIKKRLAKGDSAYKVAKEMEIGYMSVYKIGTGVTWKDVEPRGRLIPEREAKMTSAHRDWAWKMHRKGRTGNRIARKLGVSETTVTRLLREARLLLGHRINQMFLTSGSHEAAMRQYRLKGKELEELIEMATATPLTRKLREELEL